MGLVAEMRSGLNQMLHRDDRGRHGSSPYRLVRWEARTAGLAAAPDMLLPMRNSRAVSGKAAALQPVRRI
jgi:hypothetical protein